MKQTFDILDPETVKILMETGQVKKLENGTKYLVIEENEEIEEKQVQFKKNGRNLLKVCKNIVRW